MTTLYTESRWLTWTRHTSHQEVPYSNVTAAESFLDESDRLNAVRKECLRFAGLSPQSATRKESVLDLSILCEYSMSAVLVQYGYSVGTVCVQYAYSTVVRVWLGSWVGGGVGGWGLWWWCCGGGVVGCGGWG
jgi:hypothetical protein